MYSLTRMKRVTDPLDERVKARIVGRDRFEPCHVSSGSEHSAHADDDVTASPSLSELFFGLGVGGESSPESSCSDSDADDGDNSSNRDSSAADLIRPIVADRTDEFRNELAARVASAIQIYASFKSEKQLLRRSVMAFLRNCGYNAAVCKAKWPSCGGLTAGSHEFIDVVANFPDPARYFVDLDFAAEFEIARPTSSYERLLRLLPRVFVGGIDDLRRILKAASDAAKRSLRSRKLHLPPWRKHRFMQNKWLGPYRRTTNAVAVSAASPSLKSAAYCRAVGFDAAGDGGRLFCPAAARTR